MPFASDPLAAATVLAWLWAGRRRVRAGRARRTGLRHGSSPPVPDPLDHRRYRGDRVRDRPPRRPRHAVGRRRQRRRSRAARRSLRRPERRLPRRPRSLLGRGLAVDRRLAPRSAARGAAFPLFLASMLLVLGARNAFSFLLAWELMALLSALLVVGLRPTRSRVGGLPLPRDDPRRDRRVPRRLRASLAAGSGGPLDFEAWRRPGRRSHPPLRDAVFVLVARRLRHEGRRDAAPRLAAARAPGGALARLGADVRGHDQDRDLRARPVRARDPRRRPGLVGPAILALGALSAVLGVLYALMQHDLKRLLAFHSIENIGIILLGLGVALLARGATARRARGAGPRGGAVPLAQPRASSSRSSSSAPAPSSRDRSARSQPARRPCPAHAGDGARLRHRRRRDQRPAAAQRVRQRVARLPGPARRGGRARSGRRPIGCRRSPSGRSR